MKTRILLVGLLFVAACSFSCQQEQNMFGPPSHSRENGTKQASAAMLKGFLEDRSRPRVCVGKTMQDAQPITATVTRFSDDGIIPVDQRSPVHILRTSGDFAEVEVIGGAQTGTTGWVYKNQVLNERGYALEFP